MGIETEFGVTCTFHGHRRLSPDEVARYLFRRVVSWGRSSNVFLRNGARLYLDVGSHPEYATAECDNLAQLVTHDRAGERVLEDLLVDAEQLGDLVEVLPVVVDGDGDDLRPRGALVGGTDVQQTSSQRVLFDPRRVEGDEDGARGGDQLRHADQPACLQLSCQRCVHPHRRAEVGLLHQQRAVRGAQHAPHARYSESGTSVMNM